MYLGTRVATFNVDNGATVFRIINVQVVSGRYAHRIVSRFQPELQNYRFHWRTSMNEPHWSLSPPCLKQNRRFGCAGRQHSTQHGSGEGTRIRPLNQAHMINWYSISRSACLDSCNSSLVVLKSSTNKLLRIALCRSSFERAARSETSMFLSTSTTFLIRVLII